MQFSNEVGFVPTPREGTGPIGHSRPFCPTCVQPWGLLAIIRWAALLSQPWSAHKIRHHRASGCFRAFTPFLAGRVTGKPATRRFWHLARGSAMGPAWRHKRASSRLRLSWPRSTRWLKRLQGERLWPPSIAKGMANTRVRLIGRTPRGFSPRKCLAVQAFWPFHFFAGAGACCCSLLGGTMLFMRI